MFLAAKYFLCAANIKHIIILRIFNSIEQFNVSAAQHTIEWQFITINENNRINIL